MKKNKLLLVVGFLSIFEVVRAEPPTELAAPEISIKAKSLKLHDEITYTPHSVSIEQPASDVHLGETLSKLPGVLVRNVSGFGSTTTVITSQALGSGGTAVSVDDIPILDPSGRGVNFSIFPSSLIESIEHHSPFYPSMNPAADTLPAAGGRINLKTLSSPRRGVSPWSSSVLVGSGNTVEMTGSYRGGSENREWLLGISGFNTAGDFHYRDPRNDSSENRMNNNAAGAGALAKYGWRLEGGGSVEMIDLFSHGDRTNPGSIDSPERDHQKDMFNLLGFRYTNPKAISPRDGLFAKAAGAYTRTATRTAVLFPGQADSTDSRGWAHYTQFGYNRQDEHTKFTLAFDNQFDYVKKDEGKFNKDIFGVTATSAIELGQFKLVPLVRQNASNRYDSVTDASMSVVFSPDTDNDITASYGLQHTYPSISAKSGFNIGGLVVLPNNNLNTQRDSITSLSYIRRASNYTIYSAAFYDLIHDRATFSRVGFNNQFVNSPSVSMLGYTLDGQVFATSKLSLRLSGTLQRAWDRETSHEMSYKPRFEGYGSVSYMILPTLGFTVQEQFVGKRFTSTTGVDAMSPFTQTHVRLDANVWRGVAFFKVSNLFDDGAFENPGYPFPGRSYWVGYTL